MQEIKILVSARNFVREEVETKLDLNIADL